MQPVKLKLIRLITAEGSIEDPLIRKPIVSNAVTSTDAVKSAVYRVPAFLFLPAAIPAASAERKLIRELTYPRLFSLHPASFNIIDEIISKSSALISQTKTALSRNAES